MYSADWYGGVTDVVELGERGIEMLVDAGRTFHEIVMNNPLPKGAIQQAVVDFLNARDDAAIFWRDGSQRICRRTPYDGRC